MRVLLVQVGCMKAWVLDYKQVLQELLACMIVWEDCTPEL